MLAHREHLPSVLVTEISCTKSHLHFVSLLSLFLHIFVFSAAEQLTSLFQCSCKFLQKRHAHSGIRTSSITWLDEVPVFQLDKDGANVCNHNLFFGGLCSVLDVMRIPGLDLVLHDLILTAVQKVRDPDEQ